MRNRLRIVEIVGVITLSLSFLPPTLLHAQSSGIVRLHPGAEPAIGAQVYLMDSLQQILAFAVTDSKGQFSLTTGMQVAKLRIVQYIGYTADTFRINPNTILPISDTIDLEPNSLTLEEAVVKARASLYEQRGDTAVFYTEGLISNHGQQAGDLLNRLPGFEYDSDRGLHFRGKSVERILIDGDNGISDNTLSVLRSLKGMDSAEVTAYEALDSTYLTTQERMTIDLITTEAAKQKIRGDLSLGASPQHYSGEGTAYRLGKAKLLATFFSSNATRAPFSVLTYTQRAISTNEDPNQIEIPEMFNYDRRAQAIQNSHAELSGSWKGSKLETKIYAMWYQGEERSLEIERTVTPESQLQLRSQGTNTLEMGQLQVQFLYTIARKWTLQSTSDIRHQPSSSNHLISTELQNISTNAASQSQDELFGAFQSFRLNYKLSSKQQFAFSLRGSLQQQTQRLQLESEDQLPIHPDSRLTQTLDEDTRRSSVELTSITRLSNTWYTSSSLLLENLPVRFELSQQSSSISSIDQSKFRASQHLHYHGSTLSARTELSYLNFKTEALSQNLADGFAGSLLINWRLRATRKIRFHLGRDLTIFQVDYPANDSLRLDFQKLAIPFRDIQPLVRTYQAKLELEASTRESKGMWTASLNYRYGDVYRDFGVLTPNILLIRPGVAQGFSQILANFFHSGKHKRLRYYSTINAVYSNLGRQERSTDQPFQSLLLQCLANVSYDLHTLQRLTFAFKPNLVNTNWQFWTSSSQVEFTYSYQGNPVRLELGSSVLFLTRTTNTTAIPNLHLEGSYALKANHAFWIGFEIGNAFRGRNPVERLLPQIYPAFYVERELAILDAYALLKLGYSW